MKWVLPFVGIIALVIGMILGAIDAIENEMVDTSYLISKLFSSGISLGASAVLQALLWTTVGFAIAERTGGNAKESNEREWKVDDLPELKPDNKDRIPLSDSVTELVITVVFSVIAIIVCTGKLPFIFMLQSGDIQV